VTAGAPSVTAAKAGTLGRGWPVLAATLALTAAVFASPSIPQDPSYHHFADRRAWLGVPSFGNVVSNAAFLLVGALGLRLVWGPRSGLTDGRERWPYAVFFAGVALTAVGSAYYHGARTTHDSCGTACR
jgi:hypothetical protein